MGDSPIMNLRESIALEIAAEKFGGSFFGNGAMPLIMFTYLQGSAGHKTDEDRQRFIDEFQAAYRGKGRFRAMLLPRGIDAKDPIPMDNDKAQFLQTRKYQRTVIAGGLGVPPHHVGDLERATFNNVEQQSLDFDINCVLPYGRIFEAAMERDLLTDDDRAGGIIIRFNFDATLRADFRTRQEGLQIQRNNGVINPNEWREQEGKNPRTDPGGDEYWDEGPSGQGTEPAQATPPAEDNGRPAPAPVLVED
jgi:HK97 family phage portal protein